MAGWVIVLGLGALIGGTFGYVAGLISDVRTRRTGRPRRPYSFTATLVLFLPVLTLAAMTAPVPGAR